MKKITYKGQTLWVMSEKQKEQLDKIVIPILEAKKVEELIQ